jgi:hypothetical protein
MISYLLWKPNLEVIKDGNDKVTERENVFQLDELVIHIELLHLPS